MHAVAVRDRDAGPAGLALTELPYPQAAENDVIVRVYAAGFTRGELAWAGATGLTVGQRVFGLADWTRNGTLAEYVAGRRVILRRCQRASSMPSPLGR